MQHSLYLILLLNILMLTACGTTNLVESYPSEWEKLNTQKQDEECPDLTGIYYDEDGDYKSHSEVDKSNVNACDILSYHLFSKVMVDSMRNIGASNPYNKGLSVCKSLADKDNLQYRFDRKAIELIQPKNGQLQAKIWITRDKTKKILYQQTLNKSKGDFKCENGYLIPKKRTTTNILFLSNYFGSETRRFAKNKNGMLIMQTEKNIIGHHTFLSFKGNELYWVRWKPVSDQEEDLANSSGHETIPYAAPRDCMWIRSSRTQKYELDCNDKK